MVVDEYGNIYEPTEGDWTKGHGHRKADSEEWPGRPPEHKESYGRPWYNKWAILQTLSKLSIEELQIAEKVHPNEYVRKSARQLLHFSKTYDFFEEEYKKKI